MRFALPPRSLAFASLAGALALTLVAWFGAGSRNETQARAQFARETDLATSLLERRVQRYVDVLYALQARAFHDTQLSRAEFRRYVDGLGLNRRMPGLRAVGYVRRVQADAREAFVRGLRADPSLPGAGDPAFDIRPPGARAEYWVVDFIEPLAGNEAAFGLDVRERPEAFPAARLARDSGEPAATPPFHLAQEAGTSQGMVFFLPVFGADRPASVENRRTALAGFVNAVVRLDDMFANTLAEPLLKGLRMRVEDRGPHDEEPAAGMRPLVFYDHSARGDGRAWKADETREIRVAGRRWRVEAQAPANGSPWLAPFPLLVLGAGLSASFLVYGILWALARTRGEAMAMAGRATAALRAQLSFNEQLLEAMPNPVWFRDARGRYLGCNRAFEDFAGVPRARLVGTAGEALPAASTGPLRGDEPLLDAGGTQLFETSVVHARDRSRRDVIVSKAAFVNAAGQVAGVVGVLLDITTRKQLEAATRESNERLRAVIQASAHAIIARDLEGTIRMWNPAAERIFGWAESEALEQAIRLVPEGLQEETQRLRERALGGETIWVEETRRRRRDGTLLDVSITLAPIYDAKGRVIGTMGTVADISRRKEAERALRESESNLRLAMEAAHMGMWYWDVGTDRFVHSGGLGVLFGRSPQQATVHYGILQERIHPEDRRIFAATIRHAVRSGTDFQVDYRVVWPDLSIHWIANRGQVHRGPDGRAARLIGVAMDITDRKLAEQRVAHMAHHDALTGLPNRVLLRDRIQQAIARCRRDRALLAVLFLDLDRFKTINDSLGHEMGDRVLQVVAARILSCVRDGDTVSRLGGDEFVIVVPDVASAADASSVAAKMLEALSTGARLDGLELHVAASIGISLYPSDGEDAETLMRNADSAMYHAKDSGRGNVQFFTQHMNVAAQQRLTLENALRRALDAGELELHYQPIYELRRHSVTGFEALLRWNRRDGSAVAPATLVAAAEESGLIVRLGDWVLREALRRAREWAAAGSAAAVSVNVSPRQLERGGFAAGLRALLVETGVEPARLELEVTERVLVEGAGEARRALDEVANLGVRVAIDDFGTGYSGLAYLKRLPIDTVKIDQSFVRDLTIDADDAAIVTAIVAMAHSLGLAVVAEGVETAEQLAALRALGCERAQGFLLARPMPPADAARLLARAAGARLPSA